MIGLTALVLMSVLGQPFDRETWNLLASKFIVPFALFHLAGLVFTDESRIRQFEIFALVVSGISQLHRDRVSVRRALPDLPAIHPRPKRWLAC